MDPFDEAISNIGSGDPNKPAIDTSTSKDDPLDAALLDMVPTIPDF